MHITYPKIKRLGDEDNVGILNGTVFIEEKVDGANASVWMQDGEIRCGSRTRDLTASGSEFRGLIDYVKNHEGITAYLQEHPNHRLFGEWLVRHTISYNETSYQKFYLFDILQTPQTFGLEKITPEQKEMKAKESMDHRMRDMVRGWRWLSKQEVAEIATTKNIARPKVFAELESPTLEQIQELAGKSDLGKEGEGVVIRNDAFINVWGDRALAKVVTQNFKENNAITFGGNDKYSDTYVEMKMVSEFMTMARIKKIMLKLQPIVDSTLSIKDTGRVIAMAYHDMFEEELWGFVKKNRKINFMSLQKLANKKSARIYSDLLNGHESVAYEKSNSN